MNKLTQLIALLLALSFSSCSEEEGRIDFMEKELGLIIPNDYEQLENTTDGYVDFEVNIVLRFSESAFKQLSNEVRNTKYFNHPELRSKGYELPAFIQQDSSVPGVWVQSDEGFQFIKNSGEREAEPVWASIDTSSRILKFNLVHLEN